MRLIGTLLLVIAVSILAIDLWPLTYDGNVRLSALGEIWFEIHPGSLQLLQPAIERHISPALWDPWVLTLLEWPAAIEIGVLGLLLISISRLWGSARPRRR